MTQISKNQNRKSTTTDYVVIGANLSGLLVARALIKEGAKVVLLEATEHESALFKNVQTLAGLRENIFTYLPDSELSQKAIDFVSALIGEDISRSSFERKPMTYESSGLKEFLGFGDNSPDFYEEISYFLNHKELKLQIPVGEWAEKLLAAMPELEYADRQYATKLNVVENRVVSVTVNGQRTLEAHNFIYAGAAKRMVHLLPEEALAAKARQKLSKSKLWTAIGLDFVHANQFSTNDEIHILNGTTQDDIGPCVGRFYESFLQEETSPRQSSQWLSFVDDEDAEDIEKIGIALKKIKRQIKRAYPEAFEGLISEKVLAVPSFGGHVDLKLTGQQTLPHINNFWVACREVHPQRNLMGLLGQAQLVTSALGVHPLGAQTEVVSSIEGDTAEFGA